MASLPALTLLAALLASGPAASGGDEPPVEVTLEYKTIRNWLIDLPTPELARVGASFASGGVEFVTALQGTGLAVDTDADGQTDVVVEGEAGFVTLRGTDESGSPVTYAIRLENKGEGWTYATSGALVGKLGNTKIQIIDQNNNGSYADFGVDAMVVGRGYAASFLSKVISIEDEIYSVEIADDESKLICKPWTGETGMLDLSTINAKGRLMSAIVVSTDGQHSFEVGRGARQVPAGEYRLHCGRLGLGMTEVRVRQGRAENITVAAGSTVELEWGGPIEAEFAFARNGNQIVLSPDQVWYYGARGEEYFDWFPAGKSPVFTIREEGREILWAAFPGSS